MQHLGDAADGLVTLYRHDAGQYGNGGADGTAVVDTLEEDGRLEEQLSDKEVCTGIDLLPQVNQVIVSSPSCSQL